MVNLYAEKASLWSLELDWQQANTLEIVDDGTVEKLIGAGCTNIKLK